MEQHRTPWITQLYQRAGVNAEPRGVARVHHHRWAPLPALRGGRFGKARVQKISGRRGNQAEGMIRRCFFDYWPVVGERRGCHVWAEAVGPQRGPVWVEMEFFICVSKTVQKVRCFKCGLGIDPARGF